MLQRQSPSNLLNICIGWLHHNIAVLSNMDSTSDISMKEKRNKNFWRMKEIREPRVEGWEKQTPIVWQAWFLVVDLHINKVCNSKKASQVQPQIIFVSVTKISGNTINILNYSLWWAWSNQLYSKRKTSLLLITNILLVPYSVEIQKRLIKNQVYNEFCYSA